MKYPTSVVLPPPVVSGPLVVGSVVPCPAARSLCPVFHPRRGFFPICYLSNSFCYPIHSRDTHLFPIMKSPVTEAPNYRNTAPLRFPRSSFPFPPGFSTPALQHPKTPAFFLRPRVT